MAGTGPAIGMKPQIEPIDQPNGLKLCHALEDLAEEAGFLAAGRGGAADEVEDLAVLKAVERHALDPQARCRNKPQ